MKNIIVGEVLTAIYNNELQESALSRKSKESLVDFILEVFNKGILSDYLSLD